MFGSQYSCCKQCYYHHNNDGLVFISTNIKFMHMYIQLYGIYAVSCEMPKGVHYSNFTSTLEGSTVTFWCTNVQLSVISVCYKNASWIPDPISQCAALQSGE